MMPAQINVQLNFIDWASIFGFFAIALLVGIWVSRQAGKNAAEFFLSGRNMPWWLLGMSMVATTFSTDTPNLVTDIVRQYGVAGNWMWWAFLLTGMLTVFVYANLWRRSQVLTDVEFYEIRYSGASAAFLRGFRSLYLGVFFNIMVMAMVSLAAIKIGRVMLNLEPVETIALAALVTVIFSALGGLRGVLITDFLLFIIAMVGSVAAAVIAIRHIGGLDVLLSDPNVQDKLALVPRFSFDTPENMNVLLTVFLIPIAVQWWSVWYPGAEPGGGGYIAQRMLAAKNERHAVGATFFFNAAHYALRPWPWILVALASLVVFPTLESLQQAFPDAEKVGHDLAYPAMLTFLPHGLLGLVLASLIAAYMSTISTHLNWGSSYVVNDFYKRFIRPEASQKELVRVGRISTVAMMIAAAVFALYLQNAVQAFQILLQIGAGTGLIFILRWFWWRINAWSEVAGMVVSFLVAITLQVVYPALAQRYGWVELADWQRLLLGVGITTAGWLLVTFLTRPTDLKTLVSFYRLVQPGGPGWHRVIRKAQAESMQIDRKPGEETDFPRAILCMVLGSMAVYSTLFATGYWIYGRTEWAVGMSITAVVTTALLIATWRKLHFL